MKCRAAGRAVYHANFTMVSWQRTAAREGDKSRTSSSPSSSHTATNTKSRRAQFVAGFIAVPGLDPKRRRPRGRDQTKGPVRCTGKCPFWARTRTLLIQRSRCNQPNSDNLPPLARVRVTRRREPAGIHAKLCRALLARMSQFARLTPNSVFPYVLGSWYHLAHSDVPPRATG